MALNIKDRRTDELAREVAALSEKSITEALRETLELRVVELRAEREARQSAFRAFVSQIQTEVAAMPVQDDRPTTVIRDELWDDVLDRDR
ncbi:PSK operon transcription factor [Rhizobium sp. CRIBSB]|nr:PSK operon transcription factor [Rhizobium sp. CRIBSB]